VNDAILEIGEAQPSLGVGHHIPYLISSNFLF